MKKIAIAVMLLASAAIAAPTLVAPASVPVVGGQATVTLGVAGNGAASGGLFGYSLKGNLPAGQATVVSRTNLLAAEGITDPTNVDALVLNKDLSTIGDLGYTGVPFVTSSELNGNILTLVLAVPNTPVTIAWAATFVSTGFDEYTSAATTTLVPEPASMLLLAAGAAFFARRRRA